MPASVRLLQKVNEAWGEEVAQDLVAWVNEGQAVNPAELRELADLYFARFSDRLDERIARSEARSEVKLNERASAFEAELNERLSGSEKGLIERIAGWDSKLDTRINSLQLEIARVEGKLDAGLATLRADFAGQMRDQMKWMFIFWAGTIVPLAGLIVALGRDWL